ncbi:uncharacterized protein LOC131165940 isoform X2 [Malania oleifera]|uniref:uncharacterized protein LOC131165940 isoform X2 n=1 Tax=Malania oleifera TaxID=397392 RepID=UPI0025ADA0EE|nr:uncharacterized protein LOC131165940 isoform X2 [Malania oleifera]
MLMPISKESPSKPPPVIGKIGPYTVFITPPHTPKSPEADHPQPQKIVPPPVRPPPLQFDNVSHVSQSPSGGGALKPGFFWNAVSKIQNAHSSLDEHLAWWFGLNQSKYQWALDDYFESKGVDGKEEAVRSFVGLSPLYRPYGNSFTRERKMPKQKKYPIKQSVFNWFLSAGS